MIALRAGIRFLHSKPKTRTRAETKWRPREADVCHLAPQAPREGPRRPLGRATWRGACSRRTSDRIVEGLWKGNTLGIVHPLRLSPCSPMNRHDRKIKGNVVQIVSPCTFSPAAP
eukprot:gene15742-biopygen17206